MIEAIRDILSRRRQYEQLKIAVVTAARDTGVWHPDPVPASDAAALLMPRFMADKIRLLSKQVAYLEQRQP